MLQFTQAGTSPLVLRQGCIDVSLSRLPLTPPETPKSLFQGVCQHAIDLHLSTLIVGRRYAYHFQARTEIGNISFQCNRIQVDMQFISVVVSQIKKPDSSKKRSKNSP